MELCFDVMFALTWVMKLWHRPYQMFMWAAFGCGPQVSHPWSSQCEIWHCILGHRLLCM